MDCLERRDLGLADMPGCTPAATVADHAQNSFSSSWVASPSSFFAFARVTALVPNQTSRARSLVVSSCVRETREGTFESQ